MMPSETNRLQANDARLFVALAGYAAVNVLGVWLAAIGAIHPPWGLLYFLLFVAPPMATFVVIVAQLADRPFRWSSVWAVVCAMALAAWLNYLALLSALAAV